VQVKNGLEKFKKKQIFYQILMKTRIAPISINIGKNRSMPDFHPPLFEPHSAY